MSDEVSSVLIEEKNPDGTTVARTRVDVPDRSPSLWNRVVNTITGVSPEDDIADQALQIYADGKRGPVGHASGSSAPQATGFLAVAMDADDDPSADAGSEIAVDATADAKSDDPEIRQASKRVAGLPDVMHTLNFGGGEGSSTCTTTNLAHQRQYGEASETTVPLMPYDPTKSEIAAEARAPLAADVVMADASGSAPDAASADATADAHPELAADAAAADEDDAAESDGEDEVETKETSLNRLNYWISLKLLDFEAYRLNY